MKPEFISSSTPLGSLKCERDRILMALTYGTGAFPYADLLSVWCFLRFDQWQVANLPFQFSLK